MALLVKHSDYFSIISSYLCFIDTMNVSLTCKEVYKNLKYDSDYVIFIKMWNGLLDPTNDVKKFITNIKVPSSLAFYPRWDKKDRLSRKLVYSKPSLQIEEIYFAEDISQIFKCLKAGLKFLNKYEISSNLQGNKLIVIDHYNQVIRNK